jgi:hypothetical protein
MAKKEITEQTIKRNNFNNALKLMYKYDKPTEDQIYRHMCLSNNCPTEHCSYLFGFKEGKSCGHVLTVKRIINNLIQMRDDD